MIIPIFMSQNQSINYLGLVGWVESIFVIIASVFAIWGIISWRKETRWKRKYELAEEVLANFYEAQRDIQEIRMPVKLAGFNESELKADNDTKIRNEAHNYRERIAKNRAAYDRLETLKIRFRILFGKKHEGYFSELGKIYGKLYLANYEVVRIKLSPDPDNEELKRQDKILFASLEKDDSIDSKLQEIISGVKTVCDGIIGKK